MFSHLAEQYINIVDKLTAPFTDLLFRQHRSASLIAAPLGLHLRTCALGELPSVNRAVIIYLTSHNGLDTVKLSVVLQCSGKCRECCQQNLESDAVIYVKLITAAAQIGIKIKNPCTEPVPFSSEGFPIATENGHGLGTRSLTAYVREFNAALDYEYTGNQFIMRLLVTLP